MIKKQVPRTNHEPSRRGILLKRKSRYVPQPKTSNELAYGVFSISELKIDESKQKVNKDLSEIKPCIPCNSQMDTIFIPFTPRVSITRKHFRSKIRSRY